MSKAEPYNRQTRQMQGVYLFGKHSRPSLLPRLSFFPAMPVLVVYFFVKAKGVFEAVALPERNSGPWSYLRCRPSSQQVDSKK